MKKAPAPTKAQGATDTGAGCIDSAAHDTRTQAVLRAVSGWGDFDPALGLTLIGELRAIRVAGNIAEPLCAKALANLIALMEYQAQTGWEHDWKFLTKASDLLSNSIVEGLAKGFGDFDACLRPNGTVVFIGELSHAPMLRMDQRKIVDELWPRLPYVYFMERKSGEMLPALGLEHATVLFAKTKRDALEIFEHNASYERSKRRGEV